MIKLVLTILIGAGYVSIAYAIITVPMELRRIANELECINNARK